MNKELLDKCIEFKIEENMVKFIDKIQIIYYKLAELNDYEDKYSMSINDWIEESITALEKFNGLTDREKFIYAIGFLSGSVLNNFLDSDLGKTINII